MSDPLVKQMESLQIRAARSNDLHDLVRICAAHASYEVADYATDGIAQRLGELLFADPPA